jgi:hypothetical protein
MTWELKMLVFLRHFDIFYGHLVKFGMLYQQKSGTPVPLLFLGEEEIPATVFPAGRKLRSTSPATGRAS